jgi:hypothetical protein
MCIFGVHFFSVRTPTWALGPVQSLLEYILRSPLQGLSWPEREADH